MKAFVEAEDFCMEYPDATYRTTIAGIEIDVDCKIRNDFVASLTPQERRKLNL